MVVPQRWLCYIPPVLLLLFSSGNQAFRVHPILHLDLQSFSIHRQCILSNSGHRPRISQSFFCFWIKSSHLVLGLPSGIFSHGLWSISTLNNSFRLLQAYLAHFILRFLIASIIFMHRNYVSCSAYTLLFHSQQVLSFICPKILLTHRGISGQIKVIYNCIFNSLDNDSPPRLYLIGKK